MSGWSGWKRGRVEGTLSQLVEHQADLLSCHCTAHLTHPRPTNSPSLHGQAVILSRLWLPQDSPATACGTYIKVSGRHPRDADGLGLAALHKAPGGLDREAMVLQGRHAVQAELDCLWALELLLDGRDLAPWRQWSGAQGAQLQPPSQPSSRLPSPLVS